MSSGGRHDAGGSDGGRGEGNSVDPPLLLDRPVLAFMVFSLRPEFPEMADFAGITLKNKH